jgi:hypothetical protein
MRPAVTWHYSFTIESALPMSSVSWRASVQGPCPGSVPRVRLVSTFHTASRARGARRDLRAGRSGLDKGTLAAAFLGLERASQRPPDRRTAYRPPPLIKPAAPFARRWPEPVVSGAWKAARRCAPGRRLPLLGPPGHGGVGALTVAAARRTFWASQRSAPGRELQERPILPALGCEAETRSPR